MSDTKLKVIPLFPSQTVTEQGIRLDTANSHYKFSLDYSTFSVNPSYVPRPGDRVALFDGNNYFSVPSGSVVAVIVTTPSPLTIFDNATIGTVVGTLSVVGGSGTYIFSLTLNPGGKYSISGTQLKVAAALTAGTDTITIHADNGAGSFANLTTTVTVSHFTAYSGTYPYYGF
jgi:hypothetical protein